MSESDWHREAIGGMWDEIGKLQSDFLVGRGLKPHHYFLDVGCGSLRGGVHFIRYLEPGHYYGIDKSQELLDAGRNVELKKYHLTEKHSTLVRMDDFEFQRLNVKFDYALAQSVFTHLPLNNIIRCLMNIEKALVRGGQFFATFFENSQGKFNLEPVMHPCADGSLIASYFDQDPYHYDIEIFEQICKGTSLKVEYIGGWNHPRGQKLLIFRL